MPQETRPLIEISDTDVICHSVFAPKHFPKPDCLELGLLQYFSAGTKDPYKLSVNSKSLCGDYPGSIHELGVYLAQRFSERNRAKSKEKEEVYAGFVKAEVSNVRQISNQEHNFLVKHSPVEKNEEKGIINNYAHCNIILDFPAILGKPNKAVRQWMVDKLDAAFGKDVTAPN